MNIKVVIIVVFVLVLVVLGAPLVLGVMNGNLGQSGGQTAAKADAEWTDANLPGTRWGVVHSQAIPELIGTGTVTVDLTLSFNSGGTFTITPEVTFSADTPDMVKGMAQRMMGDIPEGKWSLNYPKLTLTMTDPKGQSESRDATIQGDTISGFDIGMPGTESMVLVRKY